MQRYMLDTNTVSDFVKGHARVDEHVMATPMPAICISVITEAELLYGLARRPEAKRLHHTVGELLKRLDVLPWNRSVARCYGALRADLARRGATLGALDLLIAAHALATDATLVTHDRAFVYVDALTTQDWRL